MKCYIRDMKTALRSLIYKLSDPITYINFQTSQEAIFRLIMIIINTCKFINIITLEELYKFLDG